MNHDVEEKELDHLSIMQSGKLIGLHRFNSRLDDYVQAIYFLQRIKLGYAWNHMLPQPSARILAQTTIRLLSGIRQPG